MHLAAKDDQLRVMVPVALKEATRRAAAKAGVRVSDWIRDVLADTLKSEGLLRSSADDIRETRRADHLSIHTGPRGGLIAA